MGSSPQDRHDLLVRTLKQKESRCPENTLNTAEEALEFAKHKSCYLLLPLLKNTAQKEGYSAIY